MSLCVKLNSILRRSGYGIKSTRLETSVLTQSRKLLEWIIHGLITLSQRKSNNSCSHDHIIVENSMDHLFKVKIFANNFANDLDLSDPKPLKFKKFLQILDFSASRNHAHTNRLVVDNAQIQMMVLAWQ